MRRNVQSKLIILLSVLMLSSCEKILEPENEQSKQDPAETTQQENATAQLNIVTRAGGDDTDGEELADGRIYIFNDAGKCVKLLTTNQESNQAAAQLAAGRYTLYAIGGKDLSRFSLPTQTQATKNSVITRLEGKVMDDLMWAVANVDLEDGETLNQNIVLEYKVLCLDGVEIKNVPATINSVEVSFTPLYSSMKMDGTYPDTPTESYKIALARQSDGSTWKAEPRQMLFPSKGQPTVKVSMTTDAGTQAYSYNAEEELEANHHFSVVGTYKAAQGVSLTGILTMGGWGEDRTITFDFDDANVAFENPVAGQRCNGYYVVTVDEANRKAVLLAKASIAYEAPSSKVASDWLQALETAMAALEKPAGVSSAWRLPTIAETTIFTQDTQVTTVGATSGTTLNYYCLDGDVLNWAYSKKVSTGYEFLHYNTNFADVVRLRPVIDITY